MNKRVIITALVVLAAWIAINRPGRFGFCRFGWTTFNCIPHLIGDLQVRSDGKTRTVDKTHDLQLEHVQWLLDSKPEMVIIGTGWRGVTIPRDAIKSIPACEVRILLTPEAIKLFNSLKGSKKVSIHVHSTC